jgi:hypothetical protein
VPENHQEDQAVEDLDHVISDDGLPETYEEFSKEVQEIAS